MNKTHKILNDTRINQSDKSDHEKGLTQPPIEQPFDGPLIDLPDPLSVAVDHIDLKDAFLSRKSIRSYKDETLPLSSLSYALYMTQGIKKLGKKHTIRTVPSAGARHAFETYMYVRNVEQLEEGLYRYIASEHKLLLIRNDDLKEELLAACLNQQMIVTSAVTFLWVANTYRMTYRYQNRGYRYLFLDAGHVMQNLYLVATQLHTSTCAVAAYDDDLINQLLQLDGDKQFVIYMAPFGFS